MKATHYKIYCAIASSQSIVSRALKISLIVGTTLNLINQGDILIHISLEDLNYFKLLLTYLVPYSVTTYTATAMKIEFQMGTKAILETDLECKTCKKNNIHIVKDELIPECPTCGINTKWRLK